MRITSRDNQLVKQLKRLLTSSSARRREELFAMEGARLCTDAAQSGVEIYAVLYTQAAGHTYAKQMDILRAVCPSIYEITPALSRAIADTAAPQGVFCIAQPLDNRMGLDTMKRSLSKRCLSQESGGTGWLALENVQDPANMGAIIRTAEALGLDGLLLSEDCCDIYNPKVLRGSMGGIFRLPLIPAGEDMAATVRELRAAGASCYACVPDTNAVPLPEAGLGSSSVCLIGNEGRGLLPQTTAACNANITIPMRGSAQSLNAAVAAAIVMWEMAKEAGR